jgi:adenosine deaminase CECR1
MCSYALIKHPKLMKMVKEKGIAIEINPISNQVLKLVNDLRNHPAGYFFAENLPVVVSNDDPGFWGARALSYDFYEAFIGIMSRKADLRALKQLALNSITYSCMNDSENQKLMDIWNKRWRNFLTEILDDY